RRSMVGAGLPMRTARVRATRFQRPDFTPSWGHGPIRRGYETPRVAPRRCRMTTTTTYHAHRSLPASVTAGGLPPKGALRRLVLRTNLVISEGYARAAASGSRANAPRRDG